MRYFRGANGFFFALSISFATVHAETSDNILKLVADNQAEQAFELAQKQMAAEIGNDKFDSAVASAAYGSGHFVEALFALDRILINAPTNHTARFLYAQCLFKLNDLRGSAVHLKVLKESQATPKLKQAALELQQIIDRKGDTSRSRISTGTAAQLK